MPRTRKIVLYLVRHGVTEANRRVVYAGRVDDDLLPGAYQNVKEVASYLGNKEIVRIMSSPQRRSHQSARPLADILKMDVESCDELAEVEMGPWTGLTSADIAELFPDEWTVWRKSPENIVLQGFEGLKEAEKRASRLLDRIIDRELPDGAVVAFTHETIMKILIGFVAGVGLTIYRHLIIPNASVSSLVFDGLDWELRSLNEFVAGGDW